MLFNSLTFAFFFISVIVLFYLLPKHFKNLFLLLASYYFYFCGKAEYLILLIGLTLLNYFGAIYLVKISNHKIKNTFFTILISINLSPLLFFKYFNFFSSSLQELFNNFNILWNLPLLHIIIPLGISFYTFMGVGYIIDVYWQSRVPEKNIINFSLYMAFFPQILSGPIPRSTDLMPQFYNQSLFTYENASDGLKLMLWGFFQKIVIADNLSTYVNTIYDNVAFHSGSSILFATYLFAFQLYADFAGYSNIAIGAAKILGFNLMENFRKPYFSTSVTEYWKRNHISLTSWLRDYIFYPLMGTSASLIRVSINIIIMFLISGLWHGANWTFIIWGLIQGLYLVWDIWTRKFHKKINNYFKKKGLLHLKEGFDSVITFNLIVLGLVFFRANTVEDGLCAIQSIFSFKWAALFMGDSPTLLYGLCGILFLMAIEFLQKDLSFVEYINRHNQLWRWSFYNVCIIMIMLIGALNGGSFIYFKF